MTGLTLPGALIAFTLGFVFHQILFLLLPQINPSSQCKPSSACSPHACQTIRIVRPAVTPSLASSEYVDPVIPPYLMSEICIRSHNDPSIIASIQEMQQIEKLGFGPLALGAAGGAKVEIYDAQGGESRPGEKARFEGDKPSSDKEVNACYDYSLQIRKFYKNAFDRNSIDGKGMKLISTVNFGNDFSNAFWDGVQMTYGRPGDASPFRSFVLLDIACHEATHGVTQKDSDLEYYGQSGALNESLSDIFGALVVQYTKNQTADKASWLSGEGIWKKSIKGRALRDMANPGQAYDDPKIGKDPQPAHMKDYIKTRQDNGGVHYNSGIPNRAFVLFAKSVGGNAWKEPGQIWYKARTLAGRKPSFAQFANQTLEAAKKLGYEKDLEVLKNSWLEVGVSPSATAADTATPSRLNNDDSTTIYGVN